MLADIIFSQQNIVLNDSVEIPTFIRRGIGGKYDGQETLSRKS